MKIFKIIAVIFCFIAMAGCTSLPPLTATPYTDQATWPKVTQDKAYTACLTALQMQNYTIYPIGTSKESGLIITDEETFVPVFPCGFYPDYNAQYTRYEDKIKGHYKLQILVSAIEDKVLISVNVKAHWGNTVNSTETTNPTVMNSIPCTNNLKTAINNRVSKDMDQLFTQINLILGPSDYHRCEKTLTWDF